MRCKACNKLLSDSELFRKDDNGFVDLCGQCFHSGVSRQVDDDIGTVVQYSDNILYSPNEEDYG